jgi:O-methyltransferase
MSNDPKQLYLSLLKQTLSFNLWHEPPIPLETFNYRRSSFRRGLVSFVSRTLALGRMQLVKKQAISQEQREEGHIWPGYADTMIGLKRLDNIQNCVESVLRDNVQGDMIETGVWRGGACILMRAILAAHGVEDRKVFVADSFEGLPKPDPAAYPADAGDVHYVHQILAVSQQQVENNFKRYGLLDDQVFFLKGWFKDTLPDAPIQKLSLMRLDGDMYSSTMDALQNLYPKLSVGGFCIIDDFASPACEAAVNDYRKEHGITATIEEVDWTGRYWKKV